MNSIRVVREAVLRRFLPACSSVLLTVLATGALKNPQALTWAGLAAAGSEIAMLSAGFASVLALARHALPAGPRLLRRSLIAGFAAPFGIGIASVFAQGASFPTILVLSLATGTIAGVAVAWFHRTKTVNDPLLDPAVRLELEQLDRELAAASHPSAELGAMLRDDEGETARLRHTADERQRTPPSE